MQAFRHGKGAAAKPARVHAERRWIRGLAWLVALLFAVAASVVAFSAIHPGH
jgi:hypothetical protein